MGQGARGATFSRDGRYRYSLHRRWGTGPRLAWVMLNPSTADATRDDPTLRRCIALSRAWGFGALEVINLCALRSPDPRVLAAAADPVGPGNARALRRALQRADAVMAAWGVPPRGLGARAAAMRRRLPAGTLSLGLTAAGQPRHPLYVPARTLPRPFDSLTVRSTPPTMAA